MVRGGPCCWHWGSWQTGKSRRSADAVESPGSLKSGRSRSSIARTSSGRNLRNLNFGVSWNTFWTLSDFTSFPGLRSRRRSVEVTQHRGVDRLRGASEPGGIGRSSAGVWHFLYQVLKGQTNLNEAGKEVELTCKNAQCSASFDEKNPKVATPLCLTHYTATGLRLHLLL